MTRPILPAEPPAPSLLEREGELARLHELVDTLIDEGAGGMALIEGPPGIGKSRLLQAAVGRAAPLGARVLKARGGELESQLAFGVVRQLFGPAVEALSVADRRVVLEGPAALVTRVLGLGPSRGREQGDPMYGLERLVFNLAERSALLLAIDDLQWVDDASAQFLTYLFRRSEGRPVLLLATVRAGADGEAIADLTRSADILRPGPLSDDGVGRLLETIMGSPSDSTLVSACRRVTGGTPFFVEEVGRALVDLDEPDRLPAIERIAPATIGRAVVDRIRRLPHPAQVLAETVALFPTGATLIDAAAVADLDPAAAASAADALIGSAVFAPGATLAFKHPVMRSSVYDQLGVFGRRQGHARAADVLARHGADVEAVADHLLAAETSGDAAHVDILDEAAHRAELAGAPAAAVRYLERALDEPMPRQRRGELWHRLGRIQAASSPSVAEPSFRLALAETTGSVDRVAISTDLASTLLRTGQADAAVEVLLGIREEAIAIDRDHGLAVDGLLAAAAWESRDHTELYPTVADALPRDVVGSTAGERFALIQVAARMFDRCEPHDGVIDVLRRATSGRAAHDELGRPDLVDAMQFLVSCGALDEAERLCLRWQEEARERGPDTLYLDSQVGLARIRWYQGAIQECEAIARLGVDLPGGSLESRSAMSDWLAAIAMAQGSLDEARRWIGTTSSPERVDLEPFSIEVAHDVQRGQLALAESRPADAVEALERAWAGVAQRGSTNPAETHWVGDLIDALIAVDRRDEAAAVAAGLLERAERFGAPRPLGLIHRALGQCLRGERGLEHLELAVGILSPSPYRLDAAKAHLALGSALRRANRRSAARPHLREALDYAHRTRLRPLAQRADDELRATGARPRRIVLRGVDALTPSEARIAALAADGMTNREIASHLFVTVKTVEMHLANAFAKLDVSSRRDLTAVLAKVPGATP